MNDWKNQKRLKFYIESFDALNIQTQKFLARMLVYFSDDNRVIQKDEQIYPLIFRENNIK